MPAEKKQNAGSRRYGENLLPFNLKYVRYGVKHISSLK